MKETDIRTVTTAALPAFVAAALLVLSAVGCGPAQKRSAEPAEEASAAKATKTELPSSRHRTVAGDYVQLDRLARDGVLVVSFWATWCKPCKAEFPFLERLAKDYGDKGLRIIAISVDGPESQAEVRPFLRRNRYEIPVVVDGRGGLAAQLNPRSAVPMALIYKNGRRVKTHEGFQPGSQDQIEAELKALLAAP